MLAAVSSPEFQRLRDTAQANLALGEAGCRLLTDEWPEVYKAERTGVFGNAEALAACPGLNAEGGQWVRIDRGGGVGVALQVAAGRVNLSVSWLMAPLLNHGSPMWILACAYEGDHQLCVRGGDPVLEIDWLDDGAMLEAVPEERKFAYFGFDRHLPAGLPDGVRCGALGVGIVATPARYAAVCTADDYSLPTSGVDVARSDPWLARDHFVRWAGGVPTGWAVLAVDDRVVLRRWRPAGVTDRRTLRRVEGIMCGTPYTYLDPTSDGPDLTKLPAP